MRIVVLDQHGLISDDIDWSGLRDIGPIAAYDQTPPDLVTERVGDAELLFTNKTVISSDTLDRCPDLKFIGVLATGFDVVDIAAAAQRGVVVSNVPTYGTASVSQLATALLLELCHRVGDHNNDVRRGGWSARQRWCYWLTPLTELNGKTLGIIGFGRIGQAFGRIAQALGMRILAYDGSPDGTLESDAVRFASLEEVFRSSDVISLHCPLTDETRGIINSGTIGLMKTSALLLNTSRGPLIVEGDLARALNSGRIAGAGLDVLNDEPPLPGNPLLSARNCIITPHMAWGTIDARRRIVQISQDNLRAFLAGTPTNVVAIKSL